MAEAGDKSGLAIEGAKAAYERLTNDRAPYIQRAEDNAKYTSPSAFPKGSNGSTTNYDTPYQSVGARGYNNLASKLMLASFPVGDPFFKLTINEFALKQVGDAEIIQQTNIGLSLVERVAMRYIEGANFRPTIFEMMRQLVMAGNALVFLPPGEQAIKLYRLTSFVCERDTIGSVMQLITLDRAAWITLPEEVRTALPGDYSEKPAEKVEIYTHIYRDPDADRWLSYQEIDGVVIESTKNEFPIDACPWIPVRLYKSDGESYGRSFVEEYLGDLVSLEKLSQSIVEFAQAASKIIFLVNPSGQTAVRRITKARNGSFVAGRKSDIEVFQLEKYADFQVAKSTADGLEARLGFAFLLNSAVQRQAERVTAEEIRYVANELEATLGGVYSVLSNEFQLPLARRLLVDLQLTKKIPDLPKEAVEPKVVTGLDAIGRGQDLEKLSIFQGVAQVALQSGAGQSFNWDNWLLRLAEAAGIDPQGLLLTPAERQAAQQAQTAQAGMQAAAVAGGKAAGENMGAASTENTDAMAAQAGGGL